MCAALAVVGICVSLACNDNSNPPPQFNEPLAVGDGGALPPIKLTKRDKAGLTGSVGATEGSSGSSSGSSTESGSGETVTIDDSSPQALADTLVAVLKAGSLKQLPELFVPDDKEVMQQMVDVLVPVTEAAAELKKACEAKFPNSAAQFASISESTKGAMPQLTITDIQTTDDDNAEGKSTKSGPGGEQTETIHFKRIEGKWRVVAPESAKAGTPADLEQVKAMMTKMAETMRSIAQRVNDGEIADEEALGKEMAGLMFGMLGGAMPPDAANNNATTEPPPDEEKPAEQPQNNKPKDRGPDPLDGTAPLPGVLPRG